MDCRTDIFREQAYEDFAKGQFQNKSEGFNRLMKNYTSEVSPDRKGIITSGLKAVSGNSDYIEFYDKNDTPRRNMPDGMRAFPM